VLLGGVGLLAACSSDSEPVQRSALSLTDTAAVAPFEPTLTLTSPDGLLRLEVGTDELRRPRYRVIRSDEDADISVITDSTLGLETSIGSFSTADTVLAVGDAKLITDSYTLPHGKARTSSVDAWTQTVLAGDLSIDLWVANTAIAFRYRIANEIAGGVVDWERTSFAVPPESEAWLQPHDPPTLYTPAYERLRSRVSTAGSPGNTTHGWTFPSLFANAQGWTLITESALEDGAAGSHFSPAATNGEFLLDFAARGEGNGVGDPRPSINGEWTSPWRIIMHSENVADIVESDHVRHLSPGPPAHAGTDFTWVEPGRVSWSWWSDHASSRDANAMEPFIDLASDLGWEYSLVDANWDTFGEERLAELVDYAAERNVELFLWYNSGGTNNAVTEAPRGRMVDEATRREEFAMLAEIGIVGVKVDFFHSDKPVTIQQYRDIMTDAADFELMTNFHGSTVPRGWQREFPHLMTMEAVRGAEMYTFDPSYQRSAPRQNTVLPFTRNVVGPMDYTPVILGDVVTRTTTNSHELALTVVFESPLLHLVDTPEAYLSQPPEVVDLLSTVPVVWDETRFVGGHPEEHVTIARRLGGDWWVGAISALEEPMSVSVDLDDLGVRAGATRTQVCDDPTWDHRAVGTNLDPSRYLIISDEISNPEQNLSLVLAPNGGCLVRFTN